MDQPSQKTPAIEALNLLIDYLEQQRESNPFLTLPSSLVAHLTPMRSPQSLLATPQKAKKIDPLSPKLPFSKSTSNQASHHETHQPKPIQHPAEKKALPPSQRSNKGAVFDPTPYREVIQQIAPTLAWHDPPQDTLAKQISGQWLTQRETPITILVESTHGPAFHRIEQALTQQIAPTKILAIETVNRWNGWDSLFQAPLLKLILTTRSALNAYPPLASLEHHPLQSSDRPTLIVVQPGDLEVAIQKRALWKKIQHAYTQQS